MRRAAAAEARRLLRVLLLWVRSLSTEADGRFVTGINSCPCRQGDPIEIFYCSAECPLLAQSGHHAAEFQCLLLGV